MNKSDTGNADAARHLHVVDAGADHGAEPRALHQDIQRNRRDDREHKHHETEGREREAGKADRRTQLGWRGQRPRVAGPDQQAQVRNDERDAERDQHLPLHVAGQLAQDQPLEQDADQSDAEAGAEHREPEAAAEVGDGGAEIGAEHEEAAMREIGNAHQAEGEREAGGEQKQQAAEGDAVQRLDDPELHCRFVIPAARNCARAGIHNHRRLDVARSECLCDFCGYGFRARGLAPAPRNDSGAHSKFFAGGQSRE